ncbi:hypothetical protein ACKUUI_05950 [Mycobacterium seoulense]|uniref:hypothetical protein n=1 Tax=Mycobacterium seoulense TaxID=386911 RepID=UPI003CEB9165
MPNLVFSLDDNGVPTVGPDPVILSLRTDMWRFWLREAVDTAAVAAAVADEIPPLYEQFELGEATDEELDELSIRELIASMRAITACAFAIDAFYAGVKARSPKHPDQEAWSRNKTPRPTQVTETIIYHLKIADSGVRNKMRTWVPEIYRLRDLAVHPDSEFQEAVYHPDLNVGVDQKFMIFRRDNAVKATAATLAMLDYFVLYLDRGSEELAQQKEGARRHVDELLDRYEATNLVPRVERQVPKQESGTE